MPGKHDEARAVAAESEPPPLRQEMFTTLLWCLGVAVGLTFILVSFTDGTERWLGGFLVNLIISLAIGFSLHAGFRWALPPLLDRFPGRLGFWLGHLTLVVGGVLVGTEVAIRVIGWLGGSPATEMRADVLRIGLVIALVIVTVLVAFDRLRDHARRTELRAEQAQREALQAQLSVLQAQTNPHFLFNALNSVAGLIDEDPGAAERALEKMSRLFRYALEGSKTDWVRLAAELATVDDYLEVERLRLGERLRGTIETEGRVENLLVPPLVLQPLVENAVLHAVAPRRGGGRVEVLARRRDSRLTLTVTDDGPGFGRSPHRGSGGSLADLERRLELIYDGVARLTTHSPAGGGCRVEVELPIRETGEGPA